MISMLGDRSRRADTAPREPPASTVYIVDDDISVRESLEALLRLEGSEVRTFPSAQEFLAQDQIGGPGCLVLDIDLPELNGLELQERLNDRDIGLPIIFITGYGDIPMTVRAMKAGAIEFLTKPLKGDELLEAIAGALQRSRDTFADRTELGLLRAAYRALSKREREVMALVVAGRLNKQVGGDLGISEITVKAHRGRVMRKMHARSLPELVDMARRLGVNDGAPG